MKTKPILKKIIHYMIAVFVLIILFFFVAENRSMFIFLAILGVLFLALGIWLIILARKEKGRLKLFLMVTGISSVAPFAGTILHNMFYAFAITFEKLAFLFEALHATFFIISLVMAPLAFIVGIIGSLICLKKV